METDTDIATTSSIQGLPSELLNSVFEFLDPDFAVLVNLMGVAHRWRELILQTPTFWTFIVIRAYHEQSKKSFEALISRLTLQFKCSGTLPLDVRWFTNTNEYRVDRILYLIGELAPFNRWRKLVVSSRGIIRDLSQCGEFTSLETVRLFSDTPRIWLDHIDRTATQLRHVDAFYSDLRWNEITLGLPNALKRIDTISFPNRFMASVDVPPNITHAHFHDHFDIPLSNITNLNCKRFNADSIGLGHLPQIQTLHTLQWKWNGNPVNISSSSLRHLVLPSMNLHNLDYLTSPNLRTLHVICRTRNENWPPFSVPRSWHSCKNLINLTLELRLPIGGVVSILHSMTVLRNLTVQVDGLEEGSLSTTFAAVDQTSKEAVWKFCPVLEHLVMRISPSKENFSRWWEEIGNVKKVRFNSPLKTVLLEVRKYREFD
jgi:hypothetical protein